MHASFREVVNWVIANQSGLVWYRAVTRMVCRNPASATSQSKARSMNPMSNSPDSCGLSPLPLWAKWRVCFGTMKIPVRHMVSAK